MNYFVFLALVLFLYMSFWFIISWIKKRNDVADVAWGIGFVVLTWFSFFKAGYKDTIAFMVSSLVTIWGLRLSWHIYRRNFRKTEDYRYLSWRETWGKWFYLRSYVQVYLLQGFFLYLIVFSVLVINLTPKLSLSLLTIGGVFIWIIGFLFEAIGDRQLRQFVNKPENKGKLMNSGLWAYTRHPNYFGEVTQWWGIWLIALQTPYGWLTIISPLTITFLIVKVSGIPLLEKNMSAHPDFADYKKRVNMFIPWSPKR